jgi:hypothetical protein
MANFIPGSKDILGWGFNTFGEYSMKSRTRQIFDLYKNGSTTQVVDGVDYEVPNTVSVGVGTDAHGKAKFCETASEVAEFFQGRANVSGSRGAFSGEVEMAYGDTDVRDESHTYCIFDGNRVVFNLAIENPEPSLIADSVAGDYVYKQVLEDVAAGVWNATVRQHCFDFFHLFGTHFVDQVYMGGSLYWYGAVDKSYTEQQTTIEAKASLEYQGLFTQAAAQAQTDWQAASKEWVENRTAKVVVIGGTGDLLPAVINPQYGDNFNSAFLHWLNNLSTSPAAMDFRLSPVANLFADTNGILAQAYQEYANSQIVVEATLLSVTGTVVNQPLQASAYTPIQWTSSATPCLYSYVANVIDRHTGAVVASAAHAGPSGQEFYDHGDQDPGLSNLPAALVQYVDQSGYVLLFVWCSVIDEYRDGFPNLLAPSGDLMNFLQGCGASPGWQSQLNGNYDQIEGPGIYLLIGICGASGSGIERTIDVSTPHAVEIPENPSILASIPFVPVPMGGEILWTPIQL